MNPLAKELNDSLDTTVAGRLLSDLGREMYFPKGIVAQTAEAKARAHRFNATVGMAFEGGSPMILPSVAREIPDLNPRESVAYAPTPGVPELRDVWLSHIRENNPSLGDTPISRPLVVPGLTNGVFQLAELFVNPGDAVIIPDLFWGNYRLMLETRCGAEIHTFPFFSPDQSSLNVNALIQTITRVGASGKIVLILNFPNNPAGFAPRDDEAERLVTAVRKQAEGGLDFLVISDDAYFGLFYEPESLKESLFAKLATCHERVLAAKVDGATKEEYAWGLRVGFVTFANASLETEHFDALERKMMGAIRSSVSNSSNLSQNLILRSLKSPGYEKDKARAFELLRRRYHAVQTFLSERGRSDVLSPLPFNSGYFMSFVVYLGDSESNAGPSIGGAERLRLSLLEDGIGTISIQDHYLRIAYASVDEPEIPTLFAQIFAKAEALAETDK